MNKEERKHLSQSYYDLHQKYYNLQQENKQLKEVIDKAMALVNNELYRNRCDCKFCNAYYLNNMRDILKEVSK